MKKKDASFWSDIKTLDERLQREPDSFCFARLSEIYLKVGLVADALHTARTGVAKHPGYLAGQRALALACNASGLSGESRDLLEQVTAAMPEDVDAQKILASLYVAAGDTSSAIRTYRTVLDFRPDDKGSIVELEALQHGSATCSSELSTSSLIDMSSASFDDTEDEIIELSVTDIVEEPSEGETKEELFLDSGAVAPVHHDPLSTLTLAELYEQQGFLPKALAIYRTILADDPINTQLLAKISQLEGSEPALESPRIEAVADFEEEPDFSEPIAIEDIPVSLESNFFEPVIECTADVVEAELSVSGVCDDVPTPLESKAFAPFAHKAADNVLDTLDGWLENIRRIKACR